MAARLARRVWSGGCRTQGAPRASRTRQTPPHSSRPCRIALRKRATAAQRSPLSQHRRKRSELAGAELRRGSGRAAQKQRQSLSSSLSHSPEMTSHLLLWAKCEFRVSKAVVARSRNLSSGFVDVKRGTREDTRNVSAPLERSCSWSRCARGGHGCVRQVHHSSY